MAGHKGSMTAVSTISPRRSKGVAYAMMDGITNGLIGALKSLAGQKTISEANIDGALRDVKRALLDADVNLKVTNALLDAVKEKALGMDVTKGVTPDQEFIKIMYDELVDLMGAEQSELIQASKPPTVILLAGLQGAGKTTAAAKLALYCQSRAEKSEAFEKVLMVAADIYRPAAIDQLRTLGEKIGVEVFSMGTDADPIDIARKGLEKAKAEGFTTVIVDTAGRQVIDEKLMKEIKGVKTAVKPHEVLLVVDAMTGQEAATVTARFNDEIGLTGAILTKLDGDTRGGAALSVRGVSGKPIKFIGVGETLEKLEPFYPDRMASRILGMGDVVTLVEKAQDEINQDDAMAIFRKMMTGTFDFDDFMTQTRMISRMGSLSGMMKMIPGMAGVLPGDAMYEGEKKLFAYQEMINVMEPEERKDPKMLLDNPGSDLRWKRIVEESGRSMEEAKTFQREFSNLRLMMTRMSNKLSEKTGFDPSKGKDAVIDESALQELDMRNLAMMSQNRQARRKLEKQARQSGGGDDDAPQKGFGGGGGSGGGGKKKKKR